MLDELIDQLATADPQMAQIVALRPFGGYSHTEIFDILDASERTVIRK